MTWVNFNKESFKKKICSLCHKDFKPNSGCQKYCDICRTTCPSCGSHTNKIRDDNKRRISCRKCFGSKRKYTFNCKLCLKFSRGSNNKQKICTRCKEKLSYCIDCNKKLSKLGKNRPRRCSSCSAKEQWIRGIRVKRGFKRLEYNGQCYRSKWEIEFAKMLTNCGIEFEYERYVKSLNCYPDFYIEKLDLFIEIHPDYYGPKRLPKNCLLIKKKSHLEVAFILLFMLYFKPGRDKVFDKMSTRKLKFYIKALTEMAPQIKQAIVERDSNGRM